MRIALITPILAVRAGLAALLNPGSLRSGSSGESTIRLQIEYEASSLANFLEDEPDVDLVVIFEGAFSFVELQEITNAYQGELSILILSDEPATPGHLAGLQVRSWGVLPQEASSEELHASLLALDEGLIVGTPALIGPAITRKGVLLDDGHEALFEALTGREQEVLEHLAHGLANKQIALVLDISEHTVKFHLSSIYSKLGVINRAEAVRKGIQRGLVLL